MKAIANFIAACMFLAAASSAPAATHYVDLNSPSPTAPYTNWASAARVIQDAVDTAVASDEVVVTNGTYSTGVPAIYGTMTRVVVDKLLTLRSVNGPQFTVIDGGGHDRCVYLTNGASLYGLTLTNGYAADSGGGVFCESIDQVVSNCVLTGNSASSGGGAFSGTLNNCTLSANFVSEYGGGAYRSSLGNCVLRGNSAQIGGGTYEGLLVNCLLVDNSADVGGGVWGWTGTTISNCVLTGNWATSGGGASGSTRWIGGSIVTERPASGSRAPDGYIPADVFPGLVLIHCTLSTNSANDGGGASYATLNNCVLTGNSASFGGGVFQGTLNNCTLSGNSAGSYGGGGASGSTLNNCTLTDNSAQSGGGGGADSSTLNNCTLTGNSAQDGGGAQSSTLNNCIVYFNSAPQDENYDFSCTLNYCCTTPLPAGGGNITNVPLSVNAASGNLRLQSNSPCINAGNNVYVIGSTDLDGNPRLVGGTVDIGACEFQSPASIISYAWLQQFGLPTDGSADFADPDHDGMNNGQEWRAGTNPTNVLSALRMIEPSLTGSNVTLTWQSVAGVTYFLERGTDLGAQPAFSLRQSNILGQPGTTSYTDTNAVGPGPVFYRVAVGN